MLFLNGIIQKLHIIVGLAVIAVSTVVTEASESYSETIVISNTLSKQLYVYFCWFLRYWLDCCSWNVHVPMSFLLLSTNCASSTRAKCWVILTYWVTVVYTMVQQYISSSSLHTMYVRSDSVDKILVHVLQTVSQKCSFYVWWSWYVCDECPASLLLVTSQLQWSPPLR